MHFFVFVGLIVSVMLQKNCANSACVISPTTSAPACVATSEYCCGSLATNSCVSYSDALSRISGSILKIASVKINGFTSDAFDNLNYITELYLNDNQLNKIPSDLFTKMNNSEVLIALSLSYESGLSSLDSTVFSGLTQLKSLGLNGNRLKTLPANLLRGMINLRYLYLFSNQFTSLPAHIFQGLHNLEFLNLKMNQLKELPADIFKGLYNLKALYIHGNNLTTLDVNIFEDLGNLDDLGLNYNLFSSLPSGIFRPLINLKRLGLELELITPDLGLVDNVKFSIYS